MLAPLGLLMTSAITSRKAVTASAAITAVATRCLGSRPAPANKPARIAAPIARTSPNELPLMLPRPGKSEAEMVKSGAKLDRYTAKPSAATTAARYSGSLLRPSAGPDSPGRPNCCVGAEKCGVGCCAGGYPGLPGGPEDTS